MCDKNEAITILRENFELIRDAVGDRLVYGYLFGSYARGDFDDESDVDILIIVDLTEEEIDRISSTVSRIDSKLSLKHNITVCTLVRSLKMFNEYANSLPLFINIVNEGIRYNGQGRNAGK